MKKINNDYGHLIGDEFAGLLHGEINSVKSTFKNIFNDLNILNFEPILSISVGIKKININKSYIENYREVDALLYKAKEDGKNKFIIR